MYSTEPPKKFPVFAGVGLDNTAYMTYTKTMPSPQPSRPEHLVARAVLSARKRAGLTQVQLAKKLKTDQKAVWRLEAGKQNATVDMLWRVAGATDSLLTLDLVPRPGARTGITEMTEGPEKRPPTFRLNKEARP